MNAGLPDNLIIRNAEPTDHPRIINVMKDWWDGRNIVRACTSPVNKGSIVFHRRMGFEIEAGDGVMGSEKPVMTRV